MSLLRRISTVGGMTLLSRVFGFVRDVLMARYLGAGMAADAFFIAFKLPNFFRRLFAEGAFSAGFVPLFSRKLGKTITAESKADAERFAGQVLAVFLPVLIVFLILMELAMVPIMLGLTGGFEGDTGKFALTVELGRMTFPYLTLISLVAFLAGILNAFDKYSAAAFVPVILNIFMISALLLIGETEVERARGLAAAVSLSGLAQFLWLYGAAYKAGIKIRFPRPRLSKDVRELLKIIAPAAIGAGVIQLNLLIDVILAARYLPEGSVSWLFYADRLNQLTVGIVGVAIGTVLLPSISRLLASGDDKEAARQQNRGIEFGMFLTLPAATALLVAAPYLIASLFERGAFTEQDTLLTATALMAYATGLPAYVLQKILTPGYFARKDTKSPVKFATISLVVNTSLNLLLIGPLGHVGLALATAIAAWLNVALLYRGLKKPGLFTLERSTTLFIAKCIGASTVMAGGVLAYSHYFGAFFQTDGLMRITVLVGLVAIGFMLYILSIFVLKAVSTAQIRSFLRQEP
ncbi:putative lipid II flippase MurJ [Kordiimonas sediminis]|uniref:Probable lipid II flippase MurJ n=1 Tax=Kordiimonas sediminis TaxID=1735581 RepID=A0A919ALX2_9PROT|nr:murein biosynthesis integral membrane protein MurJ [Kordiimonas sediminis]GHF15863.1 putative lipid II flippase MurJ [Kordiimonas sediminis]